MSESVVLSRSHGATGELVQYVWRDDFGRRYMSITGYGIDPNETRKGLTGHMLDLHVREIAVCYNMQGLKDIEGVSGEPVSRVDFYGFEMSDLKKYFSSKKETNRGPGMPSPYQKMAFIPQISGEIVCIFGATKEDILEAYGLRYSAKLISKYLKEILAHRPNVVKLNPEMVDFFSAKLTDGFSIVEGPRELLKEVFGDHIDIRTGVGIRIFGLSLDKGRARFKVNGSLKRLRITSDKRNDKGTIARKVGEGLLITYWQYSQRLRPGTAGPQLLAQIPGPWAKYFHEAAVAAIWKSAHSCHNAIMFGALDEGLFTSKEVLEKMGCALRQRQELIERLMSLMLPISTSSNLLQLMRRLMKKWRAPMRNPKEAAEEWNLLLPYSLSAPVMAASSRKKLGYSGERRDFKLRYCRKWREWILSDSIYELYDDSDIDIGDEDGDMIVAWLVYREDLGRHMVCVFRHPVSTGGIIWLEVDEVDAPWQFTRYTNAADEVIDLKPIAIPDIPTAESYVFQRFELLADASEPDHAEITPDSWDYIMDYEEAKRKNVPFLGRQVRTQTCMSAHDMEFNPMDLQPVVDASVAGNQNLVTMKALKKIVDNSRPDLRKFKILDRAMCDKLGLHKKARKAGVKLVNGSFTRLRDLVVSETREAFKWLDAKLTYGVDSRNVGPLLEACNRAGLTPSTAMSAHDPSITAAESIVSSCIRSGKGGKNDIVLYDVVDVDGNKPKDDYKGKLRRVGIRPVMHALDAMPLEQSASICLAVYLLLVDKDRYDLIMTCFFDEPLGTSETCMLGYVVRFLEQSEESDVQI